MKLPTSNICLLAGVTLVALSCTSDGPAQATNEGGTTTDETTDATSTDTQGSDTSTDEGTDTSTDDTSDTQGDCVPLAADFVPEVEELSLQAADGKQLAATIARPGSATCRPGLLLIHQYALDRQQWAAQWSDQMPSFVMAGYVVVAVDLRGHGESDPQDGALSEILTDPDQAPLDVTAGLEALAGDPAVDPERLAIVGTSVGANLAVVGMHQHPELVASVALSPRTDPVMALAGMPAQLELRDLYCLAGELDGGGQAATCDALVADASGSSQAWIFAGTAAHGVALIDDFPETVPAIIDWLDTVL